MFEFQFRFRGVVQYIFRNKKKKQNEERSLIEKKKDGTRQEFSRQKILNGIVRSAEKRPVSMERLTKIADKVEKQIRSIGESEVSSQIIGKFVMNELKGVDEIAYIRFASVYRKFKDVDAFMSELETMMKAEHKK